MKEMLFELLLAVITAAVPVLAGFLISYLNKAKDKAIAQTDDTKTQGYIAEIAQAIADAVAATSQTYVDALKQTGTFDREAQKKAAEKALAACLASISPAAKAFIESVYGDIVEYLTTKIEAEVRKQKFEAPATVSLLTNENETDTKAIAATTAAATAATIAQTAIGQLSAEVSHIEQVEQA